MPEPAQITKAELWELDENGTRKPNSRVVVQFNPESLKVSFSNQVTPPDNATGNNTKAKDQRESAALQFVGKGTTKLAVQLWFDVTAPLPEGAPATDDVRKLTQRVAYFITPVKSKNPKYKDKLVTPAARFCWGTFQFDGIVESMEESLEFFSPDGRPLRASVSLSLTQQTIQFAFNDAAKSPPPPGTSGVSLGTQPLTMPVNGDSVQSLADSAGRPDDWQSIAAANGIENPRLLSAGVAINLNAQPLSTNPLTASLGTMLGAGINVNASSGPAVALNASAQVRVG